MIHDWYDIGKEISAVVLDKGPGKAYAKSIDDTPQPKKDPMKKVMYEQAEKLQRATYRAFKQVEELEKANEKIAKASKPEAIDQKNHLKLLFSLLGYYSDIYLQK